MSVSSWFAPVELSRGQRWLNRWLPSRRLGVDPLQGLLSDNRFAPVTVSNWKLIPSVARSMLARRVTRPLTFAHDRRLCVVIPFRDRQPHLERLLPPLTARLNEQRLDYRIVVVEQVDGGLFNRGRLLNAGMHYAADQADYFCLHDVDAIPVLANYACPSQPLRLVSKVLGRQREWRHRDHYFSGAISIRKDQVLACNGFSNDYWGWGKEDDDFFFRLLLSGFLCYVDLDGTFHDLPNPKDQQVQRGFWSTPWYVRRNRRHRSALLRGLKDPARDGLTTLRYEIVARELRADHEKISIRW